MIWTILGLSVAIVGVFCISMAELVVGHSLFERHRLNVAGGLAAIGFLITIFAWTLRARGIDRAFILFDVRFWGPMLIVFGVITVFIRPLRYLKKEIASPPKPAVIEKVAAVPKPAPSPTPAKVPVVFPKVRIQGIFVNASKASAILNGETYSVGDYVGSAIVKNIDRNGVVLELAGQRKLLTLN